MLGVLVGGFYFWLHEHDKNITDNALNTFNTAQQEVYKQKQDEYVQKTEAISNDAISIANDVSHEKATVTNDLKSIERKAIDDAPDEQRPSSVYLKSIITQLNETYGAKK